MTIIFLMFLVCHSPKVHTNMLLLLYVVVNSFLVNNLFFLQVILTVYEVVYHRYEGGRIDNWSTWAKVMKEMSQVRQ